MDNLISNIHNDIPFKKHITLIEEHYNELKRQLKIENVLNETKLFDNDEEVQKLKDMIEAYEYFFPFF